MQVPQVLRRQSDMGAPIFFGIFTLAGVLFIVVAKSLNAPPVIVTLVPVSLMLGYAFAIFFLPRLRLRDDQTGDNFYYMGFIYTLTSLAVSLVQYSAGGEVAEIVVNFGVAVASTIAGIVLRIFFNLLRRDPIDVEHVARLDLAKAANEVRRELSDTRLLMQDFRRANQQMIAEAFEEIRTEVKSATDAAVEAVTAATKASEAHAAVLSEGGAADRVRLELETAAKTLSELNQTLDAVANATLDHAAARGPWWSALSLRSRRGRLRDGSSSETQDSAGPQP